MCGRWHGRVEVKFSLELKFVRMRQVGKLPTMVAKFATDIPSLTNWGEPFLLGPGSIHVAHTPGERIAKKQLVEAVGLYVELAPDQYIRSTRLREWARRNKNSKYIPEALLEAWGFEIESTL